MTEYRPTLEITEKSQAEIDSGNAYLKGGVVIGNSDSGHPGIIEWAKEVKTDNTSNSSTSNLNSKSIALGAIVGGLAVVGGSVLFSKKIKPWLVEKQIPNQQAVDKVKNFNTALNFYLSNRNNEQPISEIQYCIVALKTDNKKDAIFLKKHTQEAITYLLSDFEMVEYKKLKKLKFEEKLNRLDEHFEQLQKKFKKINYE